MKLQRWQTNLYTLWVTQIFSMVGFGLGVPFIPYYLQELGVSDVTTLNFLVGMCSTLPAATMAIVSPIWGKLSDIYGRKMMLMRAMAGATLILTGYGLSRSVAVFIILRALHGVFTGTVSAAMTFVSANTPSHKMSYALGFLTSSNFLGYAIGPALGGMIVEYVGYRACFFIGAGVMFTGCMLVFLLVKEDPATYGRAAIARAEARVGAGEPSGKKGDGKWSSILTTAVISAFAVLFCVRVTRSVFSPFVPLFVQDRLGTIVGAARYTGFINGASGVGTALAAVTLSRLGDKHNKYRVVVLFTGLSLVVSLLLLPHYSLAIFCGTYLLYFLVCGAIEPILTSLISENTDAHHRGTLFGFMGTLNSVAMMTAPLIGTAVSNTFSYEAILWCIPIFTLIQGGLLVLNREKLSSEKRESKDKDKEKRKMENTAKMGEKIYMAKCPTGTLKIKPLPVTDVGAASKLYCDLLINGENYEERLGISEYDDFYGLGGKYERFTPEDFAKMVLDESWIILGVYSGDDAGNAESERLIGAIWTCLSRGRFVDMSLFHFKKEYAGAARIWERFLDGAGIANNLESVCDAPKSFPSALAAMHYAMVEECLSRGVQVSVSQIYKNIACDMPSGRRNLDTFNYRSYNAYKMLGYEHVGYLSEKRITIENSEITAIVEPQLIAGMDLELQKSVIAKILHDGEIEIEIVRNRD
jgi:DHA1 family multidrug resistance protein-like MFS transporter